MTAPETLEIAADKSELDVELSAAADMAEGTFSGIVVVATTRIKDQSVVVASAPTAVVIAKTQQ